jgi:hypothetical protein
MKADLRKCFVSRQSSERASKNPARRAVGPRKLNERHAKQLPVASDDRAVTTMNFRISYLRANFGKMRNVDGGQTSLAKKEQANVII